MLDAGVSAELFFWTEDAVGARNVGVIYLMLLEVGAVKVKAFHLLSQAVVQECSVELHVTVHDALLQELLQFVMVQVCVDQGLFLMSQALAWSDCLVVSEAIVGSCATSHNSVNKTSHYYNVLMYKQNNIQGQTYQSQSSKSNTGKSPIYRALGRKNSPYLFSAQKYFTPFTTPLDVPNGSSKRTPTKQPAPRSATFPTQQIYPRAPASVLHLVGNFIVLASSCMQSGSSSSVLNTLCVDFSSGCFLICSSFHFLKFSGSLSQSSSLITYFSKPSQFSISLWIDLGLRSFTQRTMPVCAPQKPRGRMSSLSSAISSPLGVLSCSLRQETYDPKRASMFSLTERMVWWRSQRASMTLSELMLCQMASLMVVFWLSAYIQIVLNQQPCTYTVQL